MATQDVQPAVGASGIQKPTPYPYYSLDRALEVGKVIDDLGGTNTYVQKSVVAHQLQMAEDSPGLLGILGAAKLFSVIEGRGTYKLTEIGRQYFHPTSDTERRLAKLDMIKGPPLFSALIERFDGNRLPSPEILINILHRDHRISKSWQGRAASLFLSSLREADAIDASGFVRYKSSVNIAGSLPAPIDQATQPEISKDEPLNSMKSQGAARGVQTNDDSMDVWSFRIGDEIVRLETSPELSPQAWNKLNRYVQVLKPEVEE